MIIWGSTGKETRVASGQFHCPQCNGHESYEHIRVQRYFTLYFIPVAPMETLGEFVRCVGCKQAYKPEVLDYEPPNEMQRLVDAIDADLQSGTPIQMARRKLLNSGLAEKTADDVIAACTADGRKNCTKCSPRIMAKSIRQLRQLADSRCSPVCPLSPLWGERVGVRGAVPVLDPFLVRRCFTSA